MMILLLVLIFRMAYGATKIHDSLNRYQTMFQDNSYLKSLPTLIAGCEKGESNHSQTDCREAKYLHRIQSNLNQKKLKITGVDISPVFQMKNVLSYERLFVDFIVKNKPLKGTISDSISNFNVLNAESISMHCSNILNDHLMIDNSLSISVSDCKEYAVSGIILNLLFTYSNLNDADTDSSPSF